MNRINKVYQNIFESIQQEIEDNGKDQIMEESRLSIKGLEMAHIIPIICKQQGFLTWQPYEILGRKIYFDLFNPTE